MSSREPEKSLRQALVQSHAAFLRAWGARFSLRAGAVTAVVIVAAVLIGALLPVGETSAWVRLGLVLLLFAGILALALLRYRAAALPFDGFLERIEARFPEVRSWLRNAMDFHAHPPPDTSAELARALHDETGRRLATVPFRTLAPRIEPQRPLLLMVSSLVVIVALGVCFPSRAMRSWVTLWNPTRAAPPIRLEVEPGSVKISPGAALAVRARVWGSPKRPNLLRPGEPILAGSSEGRGGDGAWTWRFDLTQLTREQSYRVRVAGVQSPRYRIALAGEPTPLSFELEYHAPEYARLPIQRGAATRGDLSALRGTRARIEVTFDRDLKELSARLPNGNSSRWNPITARRWRGEIAVEREGDYELQARALSGQGHYRYRITPLADAPPVIAVRTPSGDLDLPAGQQVPVEVLGQDDLGLSELKLQFHKGANAAWTDLPLARFTGRPREATVTSRWDASALALLPGESATFRFALYDDNVISGRGLALSPTFELRFPSLGELYDKLDRTQGAVQNTLEKVAEQARELQKSLDKLGRQPARSPSEPTPPFERSEELKSALERQQQLGEKIDQASQQLKESLEQAAERQAFSEQLTRKLREMQELTQQIQSKEFRDALKRMQQALENLDRRSLEQNLPEWRKQNQEMLENVDRTVELLKKLRQEEQLDALAKRAQELKAQQDALNSEHENAQKKPDSQSRDAESKALAQQQEAAAKESESLARDTREMSKELENPPEQQGAQEAASELEQNAAPQQHEASKSAGQQKGSRAHDQGQQASESLERAAKRLSDMVQSSQQRRNDLDLAAVRRGAQDLVSLQRETESTLGSSAPIAQRADRQTDLSEGVARVADSLYALARKSPFISPRLGEALGRAINSLSTSGRELGSGNRQRGEEQGKNGSAAINEAVLHLREAENSMCDKPGMPGSSKSTSIQRLGEVGQRQSQLNQQTRRLAQRLSEQMRLAAGDQGELQRLATEQQRLKEQLEQIQRDDASRRELLGKLDQAKHEMQEVEESLRNGNTGGELEQKQERILSRLLDAQRSVNRRDFDPQRESRPGEDVARRSAPEIPTELLRESDRLRLDLIKAEADRYPSQYRAFIEAYLRTLNGTRR